MILKTNIINDLKDSWLKNRNNIEKRLADFTAVWEKGSEKDIFAELVFCLFTPQSKAKLCWAAVNDLNKNDLLLNGRKENISKLLNNVRFKNNKAGYVVLARQQFTKNGFLLIKSKIAEFENIFKIREWLVENIKGLGYKEASHFLRNIGFGQEITILDRHILKNLKLAGAINEIPLTLTKKNYLIIENKMIQFAKKIEIPLSHLDLLMWSRETGEIFK